MDEKIKDMTISNRQHLVWIDVIRLIAIFMVICCHCCDPFNLSAIHSDNPDFGFYGALYGSLLRPCVPLFVMMTGVLLLPIRNKSVTSFYKKRILRILIPFIIWSLLYSLFPWIIGIFNGSESIVISFFPYSGAYGAHPSFELMDTLKNIALIPFQFSVYAVHMWYIYMLIGLYLFMPFISFTIERISKGNLQFYLLLWVITLTFPYVYEYISIYFWGGCSWNAFNMLYYFAGFNGYLLLGYYLKEYNNLKLKEILMISIPLYAIGLYITFSGFMEVTSNPKSTESMIELFWTYCSPNVLFMTLPVFMLLQRVRIKSPFVINHLKFIGKYGLGIYMCHYFFVGIGYHAADMLSLPVPLRVPVAALIVFFISISITAAIYKFFPRYSKYIIG